MAFNDVYANQGSVKGAGGGAWGEGGFSGGGEMSRRKFKHGQSFFEDKLAGSTRRVNQNRYQNKLSEWNTRDQTNREDALKAGILNRNPDGSQKTITNVYEPPAVDGGSIGTGGGLFGGGGNTFGFGGGSDPFTGGGGFPVDPVTGGGGFPVEPGDGSGDLGGLYGSVDKINTGINVVSPFSQQNTQEAVNSARQSIDQQSYMPHLLAQGQREGVRSDASLSNVANALNMNNMGANASAMAGVNIPLQHNLANAQSKLLGQSARTQSFIDFVNSLNKNNKAENNWNYSNDAGDFGLISNLFGGS